MTDQKKATDGADLIIPIIERDAENFARRQAAGISRSMNGALDYTARRCVDALLAAGWTPPA